MATITNPGSFMATIMHPTGKGYCRDRILRDSRLHPEFKLEGGTTAIKGTLLRG